jgi:hypothetical protein
MELSMANEVANEKVIEEDATLDEHEREAAARLRILTNQNASALPTLEYFRLVTDIDLVLLGCPTLVEKIPGFYQAVIEENSDMRNRIHFIYHPNDRMPFGVSRDRVAYTGRDHIAAAARMLDTMNQLEAAMGALRTPIPPS